MHSEESDPVAYHVDGSSLQRSKFASRQHSSSFDGCTGYEPPDVRTLSILLVSVFNWENLGVKLGLEFSKVEEIKQRHNGNLEMCKGCVYDTWLRQNVDPSWRDVVNALEQIEENNLANRIRQCYSVFFTDNPEMRSRQSSVTSDSPAPKHEVIPRTSSVGSEVCSSAPLKASSSPSSSKSVLPSVTASSMPESSTLAATTSTPPKDISNALVDLLKCMTIEDAQQIEVDIKVYNSSTNQLIESTKPPLTRDIKITRRQRRVQEFSSDSVPVGTSIRIEVTTKSLCYLYILNIGTSGRSTLLLPNECCTNNHFSPNQTYHFPGPDFEFNIEGPPGKETIQIFAFTEKQTALEKLAETPKELYRDITLRRKNPTLASSMKGFAQIQFSVQ